jgi:hypothetical protein
MRKRCGKDAAAGAFSGHRARSSTPVHTVTHCHTHALAWASRWLSTIPQPLLLLT